MSETNHAVEEYNSGSEHSTPGSLSMLWALSDVKHGSFH